MSAAFRLQNTRKIISLSLPLCSKLLIEGDFDFSRPPSSKMNLSTDDIFDLIKDSDKGNLKPETKAKIADWMNETSAMYLSTNPDGALADPLVYGNYEVSYVGTGKSQRGNPAGGRFRGPIGRLFYKNEGLFQNIIKGDGSLTNATVVVNGVHGKIFGLLPLTVILRGIATKLSDSERYSLTQRFGTELSVGTVRADFEAPLLCLGSLTSLPRLSLRIGPTSSVVLDTPYVDRNLRLGVGSRGSTFIFRRTMTAMADEWKGWMAEKPLRAKPVGAFFLFSGIGLQLLEKFLQSQFGMHFFNPFAKMLLSGLAVLGGFLFLSKGGIVD